MEAWLPERTSRFLGIDAVLQGDRKDYYNTG
jgi:hypothetical protein